MANGQGWPIRRRKLKKGDADPSLLEVPCPWLMIDIDNFPLRPYLTISGGRSRSRDRTRHQRIATAGVPRHGSLVAAFSSSAGFSAGMLKVHVFFWLSEPVHNLHIKAVLKQHAPRVDLAPFNAAQLNYIAAPVIEGGHDPLPRRTGWRQGQRCCCHSPPAADGSLLSARPLLPAPLIDPPPSVRQAHRGFRE